MEKARDLLESVPDVKVCLVDHSLVNISTKIDHHNGRLYKGVSSSVDERHVEKSSVSSYYSVWDELSTITSTPNFYLEERMMFFVFRKRVVSSLYRQKMPYDPDLECPYLNTGIFRSSDCMWIEYYLSKYSSLSGAKKVNNVANSFFFLRRNSLGNIKNDKNFQHSGCMSLSASSPHIISCKFKIPAEYKSPFLISLPEYNPYSTFNGLPLLSFRNVSQTPQKTFSYKMHLNPNFIDVIEDLAICRRLRNGIITVKEKGGTSTKLPTSTFCASIDSTTPFQKFRHQSCEFLTLISHRQFPLVGIKNQIKFVTQCLLLFCGFEGIPYVLMLNRVLISCASHTYFRRHL